MTNTNRVKELRMKYGLSQRDLGNAIGTAQQTISRLESQNYSPPVDLVVNLAKYFNVSIDYLLKYSEYKEKFEDRTYLDKKLEENYDLVMKYDKLGDTNKKTMKILLERLLETEQCNDKG